MKQKESTPQIYSVSEITGDVKSILESAFDSIWIEGEMSNLRIPGSQHAYFILKDNHSQIRCVLFKGFRAGLKFQPDDGDHVLLFGRVTVYESRGDYQVIVEHIEPKGLGALQKAFEKLKARLLQEGLFSEDMKKSIPQFPWRVGVVTSATGAAIRDIINIIQRRNPKVSILIYPVKVQGEGSAEEISDAIQQMNKVSGLDVLIVGRGGGSIEDLWAFNEEIVARAIFASEIPVISAVGHEVDISISDLVADLRAPTPSAGAELASLQSTEIADLAQGKFHEIRLKLQSQILEHWQNIDGIEHRLAFQAPSEKIKQNQEKMHQLFHQMQYAIETKQKALQANLFGFEKHLISLSPESILHRGYALATLENGMLIRSQEDVETGEHFTLQTGKGRFEAKKIRNKERK